MTDISSIQILHSAVKHKLSKYTFERQWGPSMACGLMFHMHFWYRDITRYLRWYRYRGSNFRYRTALITSTPSSICMYNIIWLIHKQACISLVSSICNQPSMQTYTFTI